MTGVLLALMLAQNFDQRGFLENQTLFYPQTAPNDSGPSSINAASMGGVVSDRAVVEKFSGVDRCADRTPPTDRADLGFRCRRPAF
jgi:hypothetical protein